MKEQVENWYSRLTKNGVVPMEIDIDNVQKRLPPRDAQRGLQF